MVQITDLPPAPQAEEPSASMLVSGVVVSAPRNIESQPRDGEDARDARMRAASVAFGRRFESILRRPNMGKLYGAHSSHCAILSPLKEGEPNNRCTCNAQEIEIGDRSRVRILDGAKKQAERLVQAADYADKFMRMLPNRPGERASDESLRLIYESLFERWLRDHPEDPPPAAPEPPDGPGEEDGPWAEGWGERAGVPGHAEWFEDNREMIKRMAPDFIRDVWENYQERIQRQGLLDDGAALNSASHPLGPKDDHFKPKPFQFFMQQFPLGFMAVANHMEKGCGDPGHVFLGWRNVKDGFKRYTDAMLRHLLREAGANITHTEMEEGFDRGAVEERQAIAVAANAMIRLELLLRKRRNLNLDARSEV